MGAAGSIDEGAAVAHGAVENAVENGTDLAESTVDKVQNSIEAVKRTPEEAQEQLSKLVDSLESGDAKDAVLKIVDKGKDALSPEQMNQLVDDLGESFSSIDLGGSTEVVAVATFAVFATVSDMAPDVINGASEILVAIGPHLPLIGVAAGALGAVAYTFKLSKDQDENIKAVTLWTNSMKDWLFLVAEKVSASSAQSTIPLFEGLQEALLSLSEQMSARNRKWRVSKMLTSTTFQRDFNRAKEIVLELKTALRDYIDQETQDRQEKALANLEASNLAATEKLSSMDDQLGAIQKMLQAQADEKEQNAFKGEQEEAIFVNLQRAAGVEGDVPFARFVIAFETFFYGGDDMPPEQKRGLKISLDPLNSKMVSKPAWMKFFKKWTGSQSNIEEYLNKVAEDNPTMMNQGMRKGLELKSALETNETIKKAALETNEAVKKAKNLGGNMMGKATGVGKGMFGKK